MFGNQILKNPISNDATLEESTKPVSERIGKHQANIPGG